MDTFRHQRSKAPKPRSADGKNSNMVRVVCSRCNKPDRVKRDKLHGDAKLRCSFCGGPMNYPEEA